MRCVGGRETRPSELLAVFIAGEGVPFLLTTSPTRRSHLATRLRCLRWNALVSCAAGAALLLGAIPVTTGCDDNTQTVPGYALFRNRDDIGEVGNGVVLRPNGTRSKFYYFALAGPLESALVDVRSRLEEDQWQVQDPSTGAQAFLFQASSADLKTCLRYVSLEDGYRKRVENDATLSYVSDVAIERAIVDGATVVAILELQCDRLD